MKENVTDPEEKCVVSDIQYLMVYYLPRSKIHRHLCYNDTVEEKTSSPRFLYDGIVNTSSDIIIGTKKREKLVSSRLFPCSLI